MVRVSLIAQAGAEAGQIERGVASVMKITTVGLDLGLRRSFVARPLIYAHHTYPYTSVSAITMRTITATELARHTHDVLDSVASSGRAIPVERNRVRVAVLAPVQVTMTAAQALQGLPRPTLTPAQAAEWLADSEGGFDEAVHNPWAWCFTVAFE